MGSGNWIKGFAYTWGDQLIKDRQNALIQLPEVLDPSDPRSGEKERGERPSRAALDRAGTYGLARRVCRPGAIPHRRPGAPCRAPAGTSPGQPWAPPGGPGHHRVNHGRQGWPAPANLGHHLVASAPKRGGTPIRGYPHNEGYPPENGVPPTGGTPQNPWGGGGPRPV